MSVGKEWEPPLFRVYYKGGEDMNSVEKYIFENYRALVENAGFSVYYVEFQKNHKDRHPAAVHRTKGRRPDDGH